MRGYQISEGGLGDRRCRSPVGLVRCSSWLLGGKELCRLMGDCCEGALWPQVLGEDKSQQGVYSRRGAAVLCVCLPSSRLEQA